MRRWLQLFLLFPLSASIAADPLVDAAAPGMQLDIRYYGANNFIGQPIEGYQAPRCILTPEAAKALGAVQSEVENFGLMLIIYDCYRPQRAVDHFMRWINDADDKTMQARYYPSLEKDQLIPKGYIAEQSGHSRGSTVDLSLAYADGTPLDMGTEWDLFDPSSNTEYPDIAPRARANRLLLRAVMARHGFTDYPAEWWHFTLADEPYPDNYFDLPVR